MNQLWNGKMLYDVVAEYSGVRVGARKKIKIAFSEV
jgi:hypothetical protein